MFDPLPPETLALKVLLADLHDDLQGRVERLRLLIAVESDFGQGRGLLLPGGMPAQFAYVETRHAFVSGNFLSVILLSQCVLENILGSQIGIESVSREIKGGQAIGLRRVERAVDVLGAGAAGVRVAAAGIRSRRSRPSSTARSRKSCWPGRSPVPASPRPWSGRARWRSWRTTSRRPRSSWRTGSWHGSTRPAPLRSASAPA